MRRCDETTRELAELTGLSVRELKRLCPTCILMDKLILLIWIANTSSLSGPRRQRRLRDNIGELADLILKVVRHFISLDGLPRLREAADSATDTELAAEIVRLTRLSRDDVNGLCRSLADKKALVRLLDITYSRRGLNRTAELSRHIRDLDGVIFKVVRRFL